MKQSWIWNFKELILEQSWMWNLLIFVYWDIVENETDLDSNKGESEINWCLNQNKVENEFWSKFKKNLLAKKKKISTQNSPQISNLLTAAKNTHYSSLKIIFCSPGLLYSQWQCNEFSFYQLNGL